MNRHIEIEDGNFVHLSMVKRLSFITDKERESLSNLENVTDPSRFSLRLDRANGTKSYIPTSIDDIASQGVALVRISDSSFVPRDNILQARNISQQDRESFLNNTGRQMPAEFQSQIETKAGKVLSPLEGREVMKRISTPYQAQTVHPEASKNVEMQDANQPRMHLSMAEQKEAALKNAVPKQKSGSPEHPRER